MSHKIVVFGAILERFLALELRGTNGARALGRALHAPRGVLAEMHYQRFGQIRHTATCGEVVLVVCKIGAWGCHVGGTGGKSQNTAPG